MFVYRVIDLFGVQGLSKELYSMRKWEKWHEFYSIHLLTRHREYLVPEDIKGQLISEQICGFLNFPIRQLNYCQDFCASL